MTYEIIVLPAAYQQMDEGYASLASQTENAPAWYNGLLDALYSLEENPGRCPVAPESKDSSEEIRQLLYGDKRHAYRVLSAIRGNRVLVLKVVHSARWER